VQATEANALDEILDTFEPPREKELPEIIKRGKERGYVSYDQLDEAGFSAGEIDEMTTIFQKEHGITVTPPEAKRDPLPTVTPPKNLPNADDWLEKMNLETGPREDLYALSDERVRSLLNDKVKGSTADIKGNWSVGWVDPLEFVAATAGSEGRWALETDLGRGMKSLDLDVEELKNYKGPNSTPTLDVSEDGARIVNHEGRHRLLAMARAGVARVPILVRSKGSALEGLVSRELKGQGEGARDIRVTALEDLTEENIDNILKQMGSVGAKERF
jgi:hypothetical protein